MAQRISSIGDCCLDLWKDGSGRCIFLLGGYPRRLDFAYRFWLAFEEVFGQFAGMYFDPPVRSKAYCVAYAEQILAGR
jgi:hypothetical protein